MINTFDIDGVINLDDFGGVYPGKDDILITGRCHEEAPDTLRWLQDRGITNQVIFQDIAFDDKTRKGSGIHKGKTILKLMREGMEHGVHFEDDEIQIEEIKKIIPNIRIVHVKSDLVEKENIRRPYET